jgi:hypothetical protein
MLWRCSCGMVCTPRNTSIRCFEAGDRLCGLSPYCISSFESCFAVLIDPVLTSQYLMVCIVFRYPRKIPSYAHGFNVVGLVPRFFAVIFAPNVIRLSRAGICPENACNGVILILLWYVRLYNHVACRSASAQNSVPSLAEYIMHLILSFNVRCGRSTIPFCNDESAAVELTSYPCELQTLFKSCDSDSSPPPSVVIVASAWSGSRSPKKSMSSSVGCTTYCCSQSVSSKACDFAKYQ